MKSKEFNNKKEAQIFLKENCGHYQVSVDERANIVYVVFYH